MIVASYNVENLFDRAKILNDTDQVIIDKVLKDTATLNSLLEKPVYLSNDKTQLLSLINDLGLANSDEGNKFATLRQIRGNLIKRDPNEIIANGRKEWIGWVELKTEHVNEIAMMNTGRVIRDVNADLLAVIEAESRNTLLRFNRSILNTVYQEIGNQNPPLYSEIMLIDGNDERGIDVGIMTKNGYKLGLVKSHIHDLDANGKPIFSRDCPEYQVTTPNGTLIWVIPNHFKSKFGGNTAPSKAKRKLQAEQTARIYNDLIQAGHENIIVLGDLNDTPESDPLKPLLSTTLKDVSTHPTFDPGEYKKIGTYDNGANSKKIDYLLLSPNLFKKVQSCGLFRKGAFPGTRPKWSVYPELTKEVEAASDHHLIWADIEI